MFKQDNLKFFYTSYLKIFFKKITMKLFSLKFISNFMANFFYKNIKIENSLNKIFLKYKPDLVIYPTHS